jgi:hypothetical protein
MTTLTVKIKSTGPSAIQQDNKKIKYNDDDKKMTARRKSLASRHQEENNVSLTKYENKKNGSYHVCGVLT